MKKHIKGFYSFLFEQDLAAAMPGMEASAAPKKAQHLHFIFIDDADSDNIRKQKYPDGSMAVDFPSYSVTPEEIKEWADKNIQSTSKNKISDTVLELRRTNIVNIVTGDKVNIGDDDLPFIEKLKNAVSSNIFGTREPEIQIIFTKDGSPTTDDMKVTFIKHKK